MKQKIGFIGGLICAFTIVAFAVHLTIYDVPQNVASWTMWAVLDALMVCSTIAAGNKRPWLPAGFFSVLCLSLSFFLRRVCGNGVPLKQFQQ